MRRISILFILFFTLCALAKAVLPTQQIIGVDTNHDGIVTPQTINLGQDHILIKPNPANLAPGAVIFQTKKGGIYTAATLDDLLKPNALKTLSLAQVNPDGTIKVKTLANLGYVTLLKVNGPDGQPQVMLVNWKGQADKIAFVNYQQPLMQITEPAQNPPPALPKPVNKHKWF